MQSDTVEKIREKFQTLEPEEQQKVLAFVDRLLLENARTKSSPKEGIDDGSEGP